MFQLPNRLLIDETLQHTMQIWRREIHHHPELAYEEFQTSAKVATQLQALGIETHTKIGVTGVVGVLRGKNPDAVHIGLRADMDALPLQELNTFTHTSGIAGKMHACGHDGHTTMLLGAATYLAQHPDFIGTLYFIFQPAEEGQAGAKRMIEDGLFTRFPIQQVYGLHNWPDLPAGQIAVHEGAVMASTDSFTITIAGKGGHAAMPDGVIDPVLVAGHIITAAQSVVARNLSPLASGVISITQMHGGTAFNVIPESVTLCGTIRSLVETERKILLERLEQIATHTALAFGASASCQFRQGFPVTKNTPTEAQHCYVVAQQLVGADNVQWNPPPSMGAEDFSYMLQQRPGAYIWLGNGASTHDKPLHNPHYDFNDHILGLGASYWVELVRYLGEKLGKGRAT